MTVSAYVQSVLFVVLTAIALFASAGTVAIPAFWIYIAIYVVVFVLSLLILDPGLLRERMRPAGKQLPFALWIGTAVIFVHWIIAGLDRGRYHWSDDVPVWLQALGLVALAAAFAVVLWGMRVNRFFSSVSRIQAERGQHVITTGPYAFIRHPGYLAGIVVVAASGIALGSWLATAILFVPGLPALLYRIVNEDRMLQAELPGYRDYAARVRWRILPGIW